MKKHLIYGIIGTLMIGSIVGGTVTINANACWVQQTTDENGFTISSWDGGQTWQRAYPEAQTVAEEWEMRSAQQAEGVKRAEEEAARIQAEVAAGNIPSSEQCTETYVQSVTNDASTVEVSASEIINATASETTDATVSEEPSDSSIVSESKAAINKKVTKSGEKKDTNKKEAIKPEPSNKENVISAIEMNPEKVQEVLIDKDIATKDTDTVEVDTKTNESTFPPVILLHTAKDFIVGLFKSAANGWKAFIVRFFN